MKTMSGRKKEAAAPDGWAGWLVVCTYIVVFKP